MDRRVVSSLVLGLVALLLCVPAAVALSRSDDGIGRSTATVEGVPVTVLAPAGPAVPRPGAVVVHGFAGSAQLMDGMGLALARAGFVVALPDLSGHGANAARLPLAGSTPAGDVLQRDVDAVVRWFAARPDVAPGGIGLVGHSMGAGAVVRYGVSDASSSSPLVAATVAVSLPADDDVPVGETRVPRDLLLLWGAAEQPRFRDAALGALRAAYPEGVPGATYGDAARGDARRAAEVPGVEHIGILFSPTTLAEAEAWLRAGVPAAATSPPTPAPSDGRLAWVGLLYLGAAAGFVPLARLAYGDRYRREAAAEAGSPRPVVPGRTALLLALGAAVAASLVAWILGGVATMVPLAVGGYVAMWFAAAGVVALAVVAAVAGRAGTAPPAVGAPDEPGRTGAAQVAAGAVAAGAFPWRALVATVLMTAYAVAVLGIVARATWTAFAVVGDRRWVLPLMVGAFLCYFWADERLVARPARVRRALLAVGTRLIAVVVILASVLVLGAPGFLTLLLPLMVVLFVWLGCYAVVVSGLTGERWAPAVVQAVPLAFLVATTFPLVG